MLKRMELTNKSRCSLTFSASSSGLRVPSICSVARSRKGSGQIGWVVALEVVEVELVVVTVVVVVVVVELVVGSVVDVVVTVVVVVVKVVVVVVVVVVIVVVVVVATVVVVLDVVFVAAVVDRNSSPKLKRSSRKGKSCVDPVCNVENDSDEVDDDTVVDVVDSAVAVETFAVVELRS